MVQRSNDALGDFNINETQAYKENTTMYLTMCYKLDIRKTLYKNNRVF
jgi:hypothetical protein